MSDIEMAQPQGNGSLAHPPHEQQQQMQEITDVDPAPAAEAVDSLAQDFNTSPAQQRQEITVAKISPEAVDEIIRRYKSFPRSKSEELDELRGWIMVVTTLTASITWNASLNPPGGVWQADDDAKGYVADSPVFHDKNRRYYNLFNIFNTASFVSSLYMLVLLSNSWLFRRTNTWVFNLLVSLDLVGLFTTFHLGNSINNRLYSLGTQIATIAAVFLTVACIMQIRWRD